MSTRVQYGGPRDAGGTGSGTGPGIDFVSSLFSTTSLDDIEVLTAREAESRFGLSKLRLHWVASTVSSSPLTDDTHAVVPLHARRPTSDKRPFQFELVGTPPGTWMSAESVVTGRKFNPASSEWADFLVLIAARVRTALELRDQQLAADRLGKTARLQAALFEVANLASARLEMPDMLRRIHLVVCELMYAPNFFIALHDRSKDSIRFIYFSDERDPRVVDPEHEFSAEELGNSLTLSVIRAGRPAMGPSRTVSEEFGLLITTEECGPESADWLGVPMLDDGLVRGAIVLQSYDQPKRYTLEDQALLQFVSHHILIALTRRQARDELERRVEERTQALTEEIHERKRVAKLQAALYSIADLASSQLSMEDMLRRIHLTVGELMYAHNFYIALYDSGNDSVRFIYFADAKDINFYEIDREMPAVEMKDSLTLGLIRYGKPVRGPARKVAEQLRIATGIGLGTPALDFLGVPIIDDSGVRGAVVVQTYEQGVHYSMEDSALLAYVAQHIMTALERKKVQSELERRVEDRTQALATAVVELREQITVREQAEQRLQHEALHDALTGLPNRACLLNALELALGRVHRDPEQGFAVLFLDLDRFKVINDSVGHMFGDKMLQQAATRLARCIRSQDMVARLGGDEFAILMTGLSGAEDACHTAQRAIHALSEPMLIDGKELFTSASVGISLGGPRYRQAEELLRDADVAMYRAKSRGRQCFALFDERLHQEALHLLELESELRHAVTRQEFHPYFQPIIDLQTGHIVGYESLLRWHHPTRGVLAPGEFLKVAEDTGLIEQIDWQMLAMTCQAIPALAHDGRYVTLNVSPRRFHAPDLAQRLLAELDHNQVEHRSIRIEITEDAMLENPEQVLATLAQLRDAGVLAALDDFGTGYSSLSYLHIFPLHALKIDRSFVRDLDPGAAGGSAAVVRAVLAMAASLGLQVIAEGVETNAQHQQLVELGCTRGQGFLFGHAKPTSYWVDAAV
jgi:diguanylate cyclase (GGDEF)-like protein